MVEEPVLQEDIQEEGGQESWRETTRSNPGRWIAACCASLFFCASLFTGVLIIAGPKIIRKFTPEKIQIANDLPPLAAQSNTLGDPNAPVYILEYGDYQCPYCFEFWSESEAQLIREYVDTGRVYFEFRSVGAYIGPESGWAAQGSYCAGDQGQFWQYHNTLFANWTGENAGDFTQDKLAKYAQALDLNMAEFGSCMSAEKHKATVEQDAARSEADGVHGTPTLFINGVKYEGTQPFHALKYLIDQILNGNIDKESG